MYRQFYVYFSLDQAETATVGLTGICDLYRYYRIKAVRVQFKGNGNLPLNSYDSFQSAGARKYMTTLFFDSNAAATPDNLVEGMMTPYTKVTANGLDHTRYFKPRMTISGQVDPTVDSRFPLPYKSNTWLPTSSRSIRHYGLFFLHEEPHENIQYRMFVTYYLQFKGILQV